MEGEEEIDQGHLAKIQLRAGSFVLQSVAKSDISI
jgi:hypothetical protein